MTVAELFALFLEDVRATKDEGTFLDYRRWCTEFAAFHRDTPAGAVTKAHANDFKLRLAGRTYVRGSQPPQGYSPKTVNHTLIAVRRAFNWAADTDRLPAGKNPFAKVKLLPCEGGGCPHDEFSRLITRPRSGTYSFKETGLKVMTADVSPVRDGPLPVAATGWRPVGRGSRCRLPAGS